MLIYSNLKQAILQTIIYFDIFDFPLTAREVFYYLIGFNPNSFNKVQAELAALTADKLQEKQGYYFLPGREALISIRNQRYLTANKKFQIALKNAKLLARLPYVKAIFITNSLSYSNSAANGDIDLAIIAQKDHIWTARFFCAALMKLLNRRPLPNDKTDKICLSFYLTNENLDIEKYAYPADLHLAYWVKQFFPLYDPENYYEKFIKANGWAAKILLNYPLMQPNSRRLINQKLSAQKLFEISCCSHYLEMKLKNWQMKIMPDPLRLKSFTAGRDVILSDQIIKLHDRDRRQYYNDLWLKKCQQAIPKFDLNLFYQIIGKLAAR